MIIQTTEQPPPGPGQIEGAPITTRQFPSGSVQFDAQHLPRNRKVVGSNPTSGSEKPQVRGLGGEDGTCAGSGLVVFSWVWCGLVDDHAERASSSLRRIAEFPARLADLIRGHWTIENVLHWIRDVTDLR
jgi:hypothetical protein